jgi:AraC family transcriptional regulator, chitin signaling transcriptional activator
MSNKKLSAYSPIMMALFLIMPLMAKGFLVEGDSIRIRGFQPVTHFVRNDFKSTPRIYGMCEDREGVLFFGNDEGVLIFDGETWKKVVLPNGSSVRSVFTSSDGRVYAGAYSEFGLISKMTDGQYAYESLTGLLRPEDRSTENIWSIHEAQGYMIFQAHKMIIVLHGQKAFTVRSEVLFAGSFVVNDQLFVRDGKSIKHLDLTSLESIPKFTLAEFDGETLLTILSGPMVNEYYGVTREGSIYAIDLYRKKARLVTRFLQKASGDAATSAKICSDGNLYVGTLRNKVLYASLRRSPLTFEKLNEIQPNIVNDIHETSNGNVWVMLDAGIDCIAAGSSSSALLEGVSVYDVTVYNQRLYVASNQGVHVSKTLNNVVNITKDDFEIIPGLEGRAWSFQQFEGKLLCSHDNGVFELRGSDYKHINGTPGIWKIIPINERPNDYLACAYEGIYLIHYDVEKGFQVVRKLEGFNESSRDIQQEDAGSFWICHGYKGIFHVKMDKEYEHVFSVEHYTDENGLPSKFNTNVWKWQGEIIFTTNGGIYTYNKETNKFVTHAFLNSLFGDKTNVRRIIQQKDITWFVHGDEAGYFKTSDPKPVLKKGPFLELKGQFIQGMECLAPAGDNHSVQVGTNFGLYLFDLKSANNHRPADTRFSSVVFSSKEISTSLPMVGLTKQMLPFDSRNIVFSFSAPGLQRNRNAQYSTWLEGHDTGWSDWQESPTKEWNVLPPGEYTFHVKARSLSGENAKEATYSFEIARAWYATPLAYFLYVVTAGLIAYALFFAIRKKVQREHAKTRAEESEKRRLLELEIERMKLVGERDNILRDKVLLEGDLVYKSKELVNYTLLMVKKKELLTEIHDDLNEMKDQMKNESGRLLVRSLIRKINLNLANEEHFKVFQTNFEKVHEEFFERLRNEFHDLTQKELHLCAFVRLNLTNKDIASILNISVRGVETARYRLRKRLEIAHEEDMTHFLEKYAQQILNPVADT